MQPHPQEPPPHNLALDADDCGTATTGRYRACVAGVDPDAVLRSIRFCSGFRSWSLTPCEIYQLAECSLRIYEHHERAPEMVLDGPAPEEIRNVLARLGFEPHDIPINELSPTEESP